MRNGRDGQALVSTPGRAGRAAKSQRSHARLTLPRDSILLRVGFVRPGWFATLRPIAGRVKCPAALCVASNRKTIIFLTEP